MSNRIKSNIEEVIGLLWALLATQTTGVIFAISVFMAVVSLGGGLAYAVKGLRAKSVNNTQKEQSDG